MPDWELGAGAPGARPPGLPEPVTRAEPNSSRYFLAERCLTESTAREPVATESRNTASAASDTRLTRRQH